MRHHLNYNVLHLLYKNLISIEGVKNWEKCDLMLCINTNVRTSIEINILAIYVKIDR